MFEENNPENGRLQIDVLEEGEVMPVKNARVRIAPRSNAELMIGEMLTDDSGQTPIFDLPAPPSEYSLHPELGQMPYSEYDVTVDMPGYDVVTVSGVQILPDTTSFLRVELPHSQFAHGTTIEIAEHTLWGEFPPKIPEDEVKQLPEATGLVVLPEPVVPEIIVVHDGAPTNRNAQRFYVPFADYIKNVTCNEIYATWPCQTIIANILAIISFTLNRVFTEWYRGQGYDFTITSTTQLDQKYVHGRNIFENISNFVDDIFNQYIRRPGIRQPLFTQYCDGRRVTCPNWMSQWGSEEMGRRGYSYINILRRFYGSDIYICEAEQVEGIPISWPGHLLQEGSSSEYVRVIQEQLNRISDNFPAIAKIRVDGVFDSATRESVETFQRVFHMPIIGSVDFATWFRISHIYVAVTRMSAGLPRH